MTKAADIIGLDKVLEKIDDFSEFSQNRLVNQGLYEAGQVFVRHGKANLAARNKIKTGNLMSSFRTRVKTGNRGVLVGFFFATRATKAAGIKGGGNHAHLINRGTKDRYTKSGQFRGRITGTYYWDDARAGMPEAKAAIEAAIVKAYHHILR